MNLIFRVMVIPMIALILPISGAQAHSAKAHKNTKSAAFQISNMTIQITHNPESSYPATIEFDVRPNSDKPFPVDAGVDILLLDYQRKFIGQGGVTQFGKNADGSYHAIINTNWIRTVGTTACPEPFHKPQPLIITWNAQTNHEVQFVDWTAKPSTQPHLCG